MICSVPHTGTRTLIKHLGVHEEAFLHYGRHDDVIAKLDEHIHFPIRDPLAVTITWRILKRNRNIANYNDTFDEFRRWDLAIKHLKTVPHTIYKMEDLPVLDGISPRDHLHKLYQEKNIKEIRTRMEDFDFLCDWIKDREDFFTPYYGKFWWNN